MILIDRLPGIFEELHHQERITGHPDPSTAISSSCLNERLSENDADPLSDRKRARVDYI